MNESVQSLVEHLRSTGTGETKLQVLLNIKAGSPEAWMKKAKRLMPEGTWAKIAAFTKYEEEPPEDEDFVEEAAPEEAAPEEETPETPVE